MKKKGLFVLLMVALLLILLVGVGLVIYPMLSSSYMELPPIGGSDPVPGGS